MPALCTRDTVFISFLVTDATSVFDFFILPFIPGTKCNQKFFLMLLHSKILISVFLKTKKLKIVSLKKKEMIC